jgi:hypothetical protein
MLYRSIVRPLLFQSEAERIHHCVMGMLETFGPLLQLGFGESQRIDSHVLLLFLSDLDEAAE